MWITQTDLLQWSMRASFDGTSDAGNPAHNQQVERTSANQCRWCCLLVRLKCWNGPGECDGRKKPRFNWSTLSQLIKPEKGSPKTLFQNLHLKVLQGSLFQLKWNLSTDTGIFVVVSIHWEFNWQSNNCKCSFVLISRHSHTKLLWKSYHNLHTRSSGFSCP